jgi:RHS repeat-associated protein
VSLGSAVEPTADLDHFRTDALGRVVTAFRLFGATPVFTHRTRDSRGLVLADQQDGDLDMAYEYDLAGRLRKVTYPDGRIVSRNVDAAGRLVDLHEGPDPSASCADPGTAPPTCILHQDHEGSRLGRRQFGNGTLLTLERDADRLPSTYSFTMDGIQQTRRTISRDASHDKIGIKDTRWALDFLTEYEYDSVSRLAGSTEVLPAGAAIAYALDDAGNRVTVTGGPDEGSYPGGAPLNEYTSTPEWFALTHDANGNLQSRTSDDPPVTETMAHDYLNRLVRLERPDFTLTFGYDALGRRSLRTVTDPSGTETTRHVFDGGSVAFERVEGEPEGVTHVYAGAYPDDRVSYRRGGEDHYFHLDDQATVLAVTDHLGNVVERYDYGDHGAPTILWPDGVTPRAASAVGNSYMFTGRPWLADVGLYDFRLRLYDPRAGRFTTRDVLGPWGDKVNLGNAYAFGGNNPLGMVDPSGAMAVPGISTHDGSVIDPLTGWRGYLPGWGEAEASERPEEEDAPEADRSIPRWIAETVVAALKWAGLGPTLQQADRAGLGVNRELDLAIGKGETETIREHPELRDLAKAAAWQHNYAAQVPHDAQYGAELLAQQAVLGVAGKAGQKAAEAVVADLVAAVRAERAVKVGEAVGGRAALGRSGRALELRGGQLTESGFLRQAEEYLGSGYREVSPGRYISADGTRQVRYGAHEVRSAQHHGHFEAYDHAGDRVVENTVVEIVPDPIR